MPLTGELIQTGDRQICATRSGSLPLPPESFGIDLMRGVWLSLSPNDQARIEGMAYGFVTTHWGPPAAPPADLSTMATPADFPDEVFRSLRSRTARIEFEVPKTDFEKLGWQPAYVPGSIPPDPNPGVPLKLRGWYIKGDGVLKRDRADGSSGGQNRRPQRIHPLIIMSSGFPYSIAFRDAVGGINVGQQMRKTITYLVASGYDVLFFDKRGHGYSEGLLDGMGEDIFRALDQLERGVITEDGITLTLKVITADGRTLQGPAAAAERLLGSRYTARTKPVVLRGFSYGSSQLQKAMAMNYSDLPVEYRFKRDPSGTIVPDPARTPAGRRGYNFRGIVAISGFMGSVKYETVPFFVAFDGGATVIGHNGATLKSTVYQSMDSWPAFLGLYATNDFETADGAIDVYNNKLQGFKAIRMVTGYHFGLASEQVDTYFARESERFARQALFEAPPVGNRRTTTYAEEVCAAEEVLMDPNTQSISGFEAFKPPN
ncbi:MAG: alpha/beta hydrolase [Verrucomicrobiaceae bacterium]|nr:alpha/beta hydrolase [Verrucomicrobiaceae bacterium]